MILLWRLWFHIFLTKKGRTRYGLQSDRTQETHHPPWMRRMRNKAKRNGYYYCHFLICYLFVRNLNPKILFFQIFNFCLLIALMFVKEEVNSVNLFQLIFFIVERNKISFLCGFQILKIMKKYSLSEFRYENYKNTAESKYSYTYYLICRTYNLQTLFKKLHHKICKAIWYWKINHGVHTWLLIG